jgi:HK97 family phage major capsid protein
VAKQATLAVAEKSSVMSSITSVGKILSPSAVLEMRRLKSEAESLLNKGNKNLTRSELKRVDVLLAQMSAIKESGITDDDYNRNYAEALAIEINGSEARRNELHNVMFRTFLKGRTHSEVIEAAEQRADSNPLLAGAQALAYPDGAAGGFLVPMQFRNAVQEGLAQTDALFNPRVCTVINEPDYTLRPLQLPGWDLSTIKAVKVGEAQRHYTDVVPGFTQKLLNKFTYRLSLGASMEWEEDQAAFETASAAMGRAYGVGFARAIGEDLITGDGTTGPSGILEGLSSTMTTANAGKLVAEDFNNVFFAVNPVYRSSPRCAWLMNDAAYKQVRNAQDDDHRPLIDIEGGVERIMGRPVYNCPSLPTSGTGSFCVFGDLSYYVVHVSSMLMRRSLQAEGFVEAGLALYNGLMMADAVLLDPTGGVKPPVVAATLHA